MDKPDELKGHALDVAIALETLASAVVERLPPGHALVVSRQGGRPRMQQRPTEEPSAAPFIVGMVTGAVLVLILVRLAR